MLVTLIGGHGFASDGFANDGFANAGVEARTGTTASGQGYSADPTAPLRGPAVSAAESSEPNVIPGEPRLTSIIHAPHRRMAIIDGVRVRERSRVGDYEVSRIGRHAVTLSGPDGERTLRLVRHSIKRTGSHETGSY